MVLSVLNTPNAVPVLAKAIDVLTLIAQTPARATPAQLAKHLSIAPATCYRILRTYEAAGWIRRAPDATYQLAPALVGLIQNQSPHQQLVAAAQPLLHTLSRKLVLAVKLSVRSGDCAVTLARADSPAPMSVGGTVGARFHVCIGSSGAALLADLPPVDLASLARLAPPATWDRQTPAEFLARVHHAARKGWCVDRGSFHASVHTVSVPLVHQRRVIAALTALGFPADLPDSRLPDIRRALLHAARQCLQQLFAPPRKETP